MSPQDAARDRLAAIAAIQDQLATNLSAAQRSLYEGLLLRLQDTLQRPELLPGLLAEFAQAVHLPLLTYYGQSLLTLPQLQTAYFRAVDGSLDYARLRAPLAAFLERTFGIDAAGTPVAGGYLSTFLNDTGLNRALLHYAYGAQASGLGLTAYRDGLEELVLGQEGNGLLTKLHRESFDNFQQADRALQGLAADELGLQAALYQGGLIDSSRPFCVARNGKVFLRSEIAKFGTAQDTYGGYSNKKEGLFSGKSDPYNPFTDCGGYNCRHGLHFIPNVIAMQLRPELREDAQGQLQIAA